MLKDSLTEMETAEDFIQKVKSLVEKTGDIEFPDLKHDSGIYMSGSENRRLLRFIKNNMTHPYFIQWMLDSFADYYSKNIFIDLVSTKIEGLLPELNSNPRGYYPMAGREYRDMSKRMGNLKENTNDQEFPIEYKGYKLPGVHDTKKTWINEQYNLPGKCEAAPSDIVIDAGANYGETSVWFADRVRPGGKVYAFEPERKAFDELLKTISANKLGKAITPINKGIWNKADSLRLCGSKAPGSAYISANEAGMPVSLVSLDDFIRENCITKVDLIKMDIEGSEMKGIMGAKGTITKKKPKLAICLYHKLSDLVYIPLILKSLVPSYKLYISVKAEIVLFAIHN